MQEALLKIQGLTTVFQVGDAFLKAVDGAGFSIGKGEIVGLVGESGCGKSITALSILGLVPSPGKIVGGEIVFDGQNLLQISPRKLRKIRGREISMIFQEPTASLNPVFTIENQIVEAIRAHGQISARQAREETLGLLRLVRLPDAEKKLNQYPHQLSGGMNQRVMIAIALACKPQLLIADEPTTALDVTIQAEILRLLLSLKAELGLSILLITHDLSIISGIADRVIVMYTGKVVEDADVASLFSEPAHPYTRGLLGAIPAVQEGKKGTGKKLKAIPGSVPEWYNLPPGCPFHPRCPHALPGCNTVFPREKQLSPTRRVFCYLYLEEAGTRHETD